MKIKFRDWNFHNTIKITYTDNSGIKKQWFKNQNELLNEIINILDKYSAQNIILTSRQLYYQLVASDIIPNSEETYKRVCSFLTDARYAGLIDWNAIEDRGRVPEIHSQWDNISGLIKSAIYSYRLPRWSDQSNYLELYCEKQAMESVLKPIADKYHIYFGCNKGYSSASTMFDLANRLNKQMNNNKDAYILYLGDHDPSGLDMIRDIRERIYEFVDSSNKEMFKVIPLALNMKQIKQYNPPPNPAKIKDPRAEKYLEEFGNSSWELDALEPKVLMDIAENGILELIDIEKYNEWIDREDREKQALIKFGKKIK